MEIHSDVDAISIKGITRKTSKEYNGIVPFIMNGNQVLPFVETGFR